MGNGTVTVAGGIFGVDQAISNNVTLSGGTIANIGGTGLAWSGTITLAANTTSTVDTYNVVDGVTGNSINFTGPVAGSGNLTISGIPA